MSLSVIVVLALAATWVVVIGQVNLGQILLGLLFGVFYVIISGAGRQTTVPWRQLPRRAIAVANYLFVLVPYSIIRSNVEMAGYILHLRSNLRPAIVRLEIEPIADEGAALIGHAITIGPGEMVVDYSADRRWIYVHVVDISDVESKRRPLWEKYVRVAQGVFR